MATTVLIIDDDVRLATALLTRLRATGFNASHARRGIEGVEAASQSPPDVIVLDIRMPDINGFEACRRMRAVPALQSTPILFLSANSDAAHRNDATDAGGTAFLAKPYAIAELLDTIRNLAPKGTPTPSEH